MKKRIIAVLLSIFVIASTMPVTTLAEVSNDAAELTEDICVEEIEDSINETSSNEEDITEAIEESIESIENIEDTEETAEFVEEPFVEDITVSEDIVSENITELPEEYFPEEIVERLGTSGEEHIMPHTSLKNQGAANICQTYTALSCIESNLLLKEVYDDIDLSEHYFVDEYNRCNGKDGYSNGIASGNLIEALLDGDCLTTESMYNSSVTNSNVVYLERHSTLNAPSNEVMKKYIMEWGSVYISLHWKGGSPYYVKNETLTSQMGEPTYTYYCDSDLWDDGPIIGHALSVVGWDDNFSVTNFGEKRPPVIGAWLCKNPWGTYTWVSYSTKDMLGHEVWSAIDGNTYDGMYKRRSCQINDTENVQLIKAVRTSTSKNSTGIINIYTNSTEDKVGNLVYSQEFTGEIDGWDIIELDEAVKIRPGEKFSVQGGLKGGYPYNQYVFYDTAASSDGAISLDIPSYTFDTDDTQIQINATSVGNKKITYESSDESVFKVSDTGLMTPVMGGVATVTLRTDTDEVSRQVTVYRDMKDAIINVSSAKYTGKEVTPSISLSMNGVSIPITSSFYVTYSNNINAGTNTASVTVKARTTYLDGEKTVYFDIAKADFNDFNIALNNMSYSPFNQYKAKIKTTTVPASDKPYLHIGESIENNGVGDKTISVSISGSPNINNGSRNIPVNISKADLDTVYVILKSGETGSDLYRNNLDVFEYYYTGRDIVPGFDSIYSYIGDKKVDLCIDDFSISYTGDFKNKTAVGDRSTYPKVTITFKDSAYYTGSGQATCFILSLSNPYISLNKAKITPSSYTFGEGEGKITDINPSVTLNGKTLVRDVDYYLDYTHIDFDTSSDEDGYVAFIYPTDTSFYIGRTGVKVYVTPSCEHYYRVISRKEPTCSQKGEIKYECMYCEHTYTDDIDEKGHSYVASVTKEPTEDDLGVRTYECRVCHDTYTEDIPKIAGISLNVSQKSLKTGETYKLNATIKNTNEKATWTSSNPLIVTVDSEGNIKGVGKGTATVTATVQNKSVECIISVSPIVVTFDPNGGTLDGNTLNVSYNVAYGLLPTPVAVGGTFLGWFTAKDGGTKVENTDVVNDINDHTLFAHWILKYTAESVTASIPSMTEVNKGDRISLSSATVDATIYYTLDGTDPSSLNGIKYDDSIIINEPVTIKAVATKLNHKDSGIATFTYTVRDNSLDFGTISSDDILEAGFGTVEDVPAGLWTGGVKDSPYTGKAVTFPDMRVYSNTTLLTPNTDYTVRYQNNTKAGVGKVTVTGKGNYTGTITKTFAINPVDISSASSSDIVLAYNGRIQRGNPVVTILLNGKKVTLKKGTDYTVTYPSSDYKSVGDTSIVITGKGNYTGTLNCTQTITDRTFMSKVSVSRVSNAAYTGSEIRPSVTLTYNKKTLTEGVDYTVTYLNNTDAGTASIVFTGKGSFIGEKVVKFNITGIALSKVKISSLISKLDYTGSAVLQSPTLTYANVPLAEGVDYTATYENNVNVGTAKIIFTGKGKYTGVVTRSYTITGYALSKARVTGLLSCVDYTGNATSQSATLTLNNTPLVEGADYTVDYKNNVNAGTATVIYTGKGRYTGVVKKNYRISSYNIAKDVMQKMSITVPSNAAYVKGGTKVIPSVKFNGTDLVYNKDFTLSFSNNSKIGTGRVAITGKGNFTGKTSYINFNITSSLISDVNVTANDVVFANRANNAKANITVTQTDMDGKVKTLSKGTDYDTNIVYTYAKDSMVTFVDGRNKSEVIRSEGDIVNPKDIVNAGTEITATVTGKNSFTGTKSVTYRVVGASIANASVKIGKFAYTGKPIEPCKDDLTIRVGKSTLTKSDYEIVSYSNNINRGTASMTIRGIGSFGGTKVITFVICPR